MPAERKLFYYTSIGAEITGIASSKTKMQLKQTLTQVVEGLPKVI